MTLLWSLHSRGRDSGDHLTAHRPTAHRPCAVRPTKSGSASYRSICLLRCVKPAAGCCSTARRCAGRAHSPVGKQPTAAARFGAADHQTGRSGTPGDQPAGSVTPVRAVQARGPAGSDDATGCWLLPPALATVRASAARAAPARCRIMRRGRRLGSCCRPRASGQRCSPGPPRRSRCAPSLADFQTRSTGWKAPAIPCHYALFLPRCCNRVDEPAAPRVPEAMARQVQPCIEDQQDIGVRHARASLQRCRVDHDLA